MQARISFNHVGAADVDAFEAELRSTLGWEGPNRVCGKPVLDAGNLEYISSAGLRVLLRLVKDAGSLRLENVQASLYEILDMTGFTEIVDVEKALRDLSVEGCDEIGRGAHGTVYRIASDTIVKVYNEGETMEAIQRERELSRWAFVRGVPTAIPYDVVRVGDRLGAVYELLDAESSVDYIHAKPGNLAHFVEESVKLMKQIHAIEVEPGELPDMKAQALEWADGIRGLLPEDTFEKLLQLTRAVPDSHTLLHADYHLKNIMISDGELMLIDMDTLCMGDPIFELATIDNSYREFPAIDPFAAQFLGISVEEANEIWRRTADLYFEGVDPAVRAEEERKVRVLGCVRIINYMRHFDDEQAKEASIAHCLGVVNDLI